jgi:hypothetical protein
LKLLEYLIPLLVMTSFVPKIVKNLENALIEKKSRCFSKVAHLVFYGIVLF